MNKPAYDFVSTPDKLRCIFMSEGVTQIKKVILFFPIQSDSEIFELTFGDLVENKFVDYYSVTNNQDMELIIGTVINAIHSFFETYPDKSIFFQGSTPARTRLYRAIISKNITKQEPLYQIYGLKTICYSSHFFKLAITLVS